MELPFVTLDVFTTSPFKGNPLAIVTIPATLHPKPTQEQKQTIAREFNLSETVFVHEEEENDPERRTGGIDGRRRIDIFLTNAEIPFAGHPTIGAAVTLFPRGIKTIETKAGLITITSVKGKRNNDLLQAKIPHNTHLHAKRLRDVHPPDAALAADAHIRAAELNAPIFSIVKGMAFILIELPSLADLASVSQKPMPFSLQELLDEEWSTGFMGKYYFVRTRTSQLEEGGENGHSSMSIRTRMIEVSFEDPATGSAACCLASYLSLHGVEGEPSRPAGIQYEITQGVEMGRQSDIQVHVQLDAGKENIDTIHLAGTAVQVMRGFVKA